MTYDGKFIIKSIQTKELDLLRKQYQGFIWYYLNSSVNCASSKLVPILEVFTVKGSQNKSSKSYIVMENIVQHPGRVVCDLKGAGTRRMHLKERGETVDDGSIDDSLLSSGELQSDDASAIVKSVVWDEDLRRMRKYHPIPLNVYDHDSLIQGITNDSEFLSAIGVVDYSLILTSQSHYSGAITSDLAQVSVCVGIIDYLRPYTWDKKLESVVKSVNSNIYHIRDRLVNSDVKNFHNGGSGTIPVPFMDSSPTIIKPDLYARRFRTNIGALFTSQF